MSKNSQWDHEGNFDLEATIEERRYLGETTQYTAPETDQKWRARELFGFMWRHLGIDIPPGYRDVMLFLIEKANARNGQLNWRQNKMADLMLLSRQYINEACRWWATQTPFLKSDRRKNKDGRFVSNAYHVRWKPIEKAWLDVMAHVGMHPTRAENVTEPVHVVCNPTTVVATYPTTDVNTDTTTRNSKGKCKEETHPERGSPSAIHSLEASSLSGEPKQPLELVESQRATKTVQADSQKLTNEEWRKLRGQQ
jgi:hypothetical protein